MLSWLLLFRFPKLLLFTKSSRLWFQLTRTKMIMGQLQTKRQNVPMKFSKTNLLPIVTIHSIVIFLSV